MGHDVIQKEFADKMNALARAIDSLFNVDGQPPAVGFVLLAAKFGEIDAGRVNYISNGDRDSMVQMMEELLGRFKAKEDLEGGRSN